MSRLSVRLLGSPEIELDDKPIIVDTRKAIALLAYLLVTGQPHRRDHLAMLLWPQSDQSRARAALRRTLSSLSNGLGKEHLEIDREKIRFISDGDWGSDVHDFTSRLSSARQADTPDEHDLRGAVQLYRDDFMAGFSLRDSPEFDDWQYLEAEAARRDLAWALDQLSVVEAERGELERAIHHAIRWLHIDPLQESAHRRLMRLYASIGDRPAAIRQYRECVQVLDQELGVSPLESTSDLYAAIMDGNVELDERLTVAVEVASEPWTARQRSPLVGRQRERETLIAAYEAIDSAGHLVVVEGEAGIGKTRLSEELLVHAQSRGSVVLSAVCYPAESDLAYGVIAGMLRSCLDLDWASDVLDGLPEYVLREVSRLQPEIAELGRGQPLPLETPGGLDRFYDAIIQFLLAFGSSDAPVLLFVDDFQWVDDASAMLLVYLTRRLRRSPACVVVGWRSEEVRRSHPFLDLLGRARRDGIATLIELDRLSQEEVALLVERMAVSPPDDLSLALYEESEGVPFFAIEYLLAFEAERGIANDHATMSRGIRDLIHSRFLGVDGAGQQLLTTAAVIGRSFDIDLLREASGRGEEETLDTLDELLARGLIAEADGPIGDSIFYDFDHEKVRSLLYEETSLARRRLVHRRIALALERRLRRPGDDGGIASQIAHHFHAAGLEAEAAQYHRAAGDHARGLFGNAEALSHYRRALALGHPEYAVLHGAIGDLETLRGNYAEALSSYQRAAAHAKPDDLPAIDQKLGGVRQRLGDWEIAERHYESALAALDNGSAAERARVLADWSLTAHLRGDTDRAMKIGRQALDLAEASKDPATRAQNYNLLGILSRSQSQVAEAARCLEQSLSLADEMHDPFAKVAGLNNLALICADQELMDRAISLTREALELCRSLGDRHREAALLNNLADFYHLAGDEPRSMARLKEAVVIFAEIGEQTDTVRPEIWKLVEW